MVKKAKLTLSERLKDLRKAHNLTIEQLLKEIEKKYGFSLSRTKYNEMENDDKKEDNEKKDFGYKSFIYLAKYYNVSVDYLLGLQESPTLEEDTKVVEKTTGLSAAAVSSICSLQKEFIPALDFTLQSKGFWKMLYTLYRAKFAIPFFYTDNTDTKAIMDNYHKVFDFGDPVLDSMKIDLIVTGVEPLYKFQLTEAASMLFDEFKEAL